jgi:hypothetical protein
MVRSATAKHSARDPRCCEWGDTPTVQRGAGTVAGTVAVAVAGWLGWCGLSADLVVVGGGCRLSPHHVQHLVPPSRPAHDPPCRRSPRHRHRRRRRRRRRRRLSRLRLPARQRHRHIQVLQHARSLVSLGLGIGCGGWRAGGTCDRGVCGNLLCVLSLVPGPANQSDPWQYWQY